MGIITLRNIFKMNPASGRPEFFLNPSALLLVIPSKWF
jgi:hypothetical protein